MATVSQRSTPAAFPMSLPALDFGHRISKEDIYHIQLFRKRLATAKHLIPTKYSGIIKQSIRSSPHRTRGRADMVAIKASMRELANRYLQIAGRTPGPRLVPNDPTPSSRQPVEKMLSSKVDTETKSMYSGKRQRASEDDANEEEKDDDQAPSRKRPRGSTSSNILPGRLFACPYCKMDPLRYSMQNPSERHYRGCSSAYLTTISRLKQHLYRIHKRPDHHCSRCAQVFASSAQGDEHSRAQVPCAIVDDVFFEKMTPEQVSAIKRRTPGRSQVESWYSIYEILFPGTPLPYSPYAESVGVPSQLDKVMGTSETVFSESDLAGMSTSSALSRSQPTSLRTSISEDEQHLAKQPDTTFPNDELSLEYEDLFQQIVEGMGGYDAQDFLHESTGSQLWHSLGVEDLHYSRASDVDEVSHNLITSQLPVLHEIRSFDHSRPTFSAFNPCQCASGTLYMSPNRMLSSQTNSRIHSTQSKRHDEGSHHPMSPESIEKSARLANPMQNPLGCNMRCSDTCIHPGAHLRLIDVGSHLDSHDPYLVEISCGETPDYLTISPDWTKYIEEMSFTTKGNLDQRKGPFFGVKIPSINCDAVQLARNIDCRFLWWDVLCIVQDDALDCDLQYTNLHNILQNATANIDISGKLCRPDGVESYWQSSSSADVGFDVIASGTRTFWNKSPSVPSLVHLSMRRYLSDRENGWTFLNLDLRSNEFASKYQDKSHWYPKPQTQAWMPAPSAVKLGSDALFARTAILRGRFHNPISSLPLPETNESRITCLLRALGFSVSCVRQRRPQKAYELVHLPLRRPGTVLRVSNIIRFLQIYRLTKALTFGKQLEFFLVYFKERLVRYVAAHEDASDKARGKRKQSTDRELISRGELPGCVMGASGKKPKHDRESGFVTGNSPAVALAQALCKPEDFIRLFRCPSLAASMSNARECQNCGKEKVQRLKDSHMVCTHCSSAEERFLPKDESIQDYDEEDDWYRLLLKRHPDWPANHPGEPLPCPYKGTEERELRWPSRYNLDRLWATKVEWEKEMTRKRRAAEKRAAKAAKSNPPGNDQINTIRCSIARETQNIATNFMKTPEHSANTDMFLSSDHFENLCVAPISHRMEAERMPAHAIASPLAMAEDDRIDMSHLRAGDGIVFDSDPGSSFDDIFKFIHSGYQPMNTEPANEHQTAILDSDASSHHHDSSPSTPCEAGLSTTNPTTLSSASQLPHILEVMDEKLCECFNTKSEHLVNRCQLQEKCGCLGCGGYIFNSARGQQIYKERMKMLR